MAFAITGGTFNNPAIWDTGTVPTSTENVYSNGFTVQVTDSRSVNLLASSASDYYLVNTATPLMTSNSTPSGSVSASTQATGFEGWRAFDRNTTTFWNTVAVATGTLTYQFPTQRIIKRYSFRAGATGAAAPRAFTFEGSNNGTTWFTADTQTTVNVGNNNTFTSGIINTANTAYFYYRLNITANNGFATTLITEMEMTESTSTAVGQIVGGGFTLPTPNTTLNITSALGGATNLIVANATSGTTTLNVTNNISGTLLANTTVVNHSGVCNLVINCPNIIGGRAGASNISNTVGVTKSSTGTLTVNGNISCGTSNGGTGNHGIVSSAGDIIITGIVSSPTSAGNTNGSQAINQSAGKLTIIGDVLGGSQTTASAAIISSSSSNLEITGNVLGGVLGVAISKSSGAIIVTGNVSGSTLQGIIGTPTSITVSGNTIGSLSSAIAITNAAPINIVGDVRAGSTGAGITTGGLVNVTGTTTGGSGAVGISATGNVNITGTVTAGSGGVGISSSGTVTIPGPLINTNGFMAVSAPRLFITSATTYWSFTSSGGSPRILYTDAPTNVSGFPNTTDVRIGTVYGPTNTSIGTMNVPLPSDVRINVPTDNTVGTATLTAEDLFDAISGSTSGVGYRLKNIATVATVGKQIASFNI